jgi:AraC-like DNA-binding protein
MADVWDTFKAEPGRHHETFEGPSQILPELSIVGWLRFFKAFNHALEPDVHVGEYEIHYIVNGELHWIVEEDTYDIHSGMILVVKPGELHGSNSGALEPCEQYWLRITLPEDEALPGLTLEQTQSIIQTFAAIEKRAFPASLDMRQAFVKLAEEHRDPGKYSRLISRSALHVLLASIARHFENRANQDTEPQAPRISPYIQRCIHEIHKDLSEPHSVSKMAKHAYMSETAFRNRFKKEVGCSPLDYITRRRIEESKKMLSQGEASVTDIAYALGFSSSQYFATVFKRITGQSPKQFMENK